MPFLLRVLQHGWELLGKLSTVCMSFGLPQDVRKLTRGLCWANSGFLLGCFGLRYHPRKVPTSLCAGTFYQTLFLGGFSILLCTALCLLSQWYQQPLQQHRGWEAAARNHCLLGTWTLFQHRKERGAGVSDPPAHCCDRIARGVLWQKKGLGCQTWP